MMKFKYTLLVSILLMIVFKDGLFFNFNNNLIGKMSLIGLTIYSYYHNKLAGIALTLVYILLSLNIIEALENKDKDKKDKPKPKDDMIKWRESNCKKGKLLLNGKEIGEDTKLTPAYFDKNFKDQLKFDNKKKSLCNPCETDCKDFTILGNSKPKELTNLENKLKLKNK